MSLKKHKDTQNLIIDPQINKLLIILNVNKFSKFGAVPTGWKKQRIHLRHSKSVVSLRDFLLHMFSRMSLR